MALLEGTASVALMGVAADVHCVTADVCLREMLACAGVACVGLSLHCVTDVLVTVTVVVMSVQLTVVIVRLLVVNW